MILFLRAAAPPTPRAGYRRAGAVGYNASDHRHDGISRISEAAKKLGKQGETLAPDQPWKKIRSLGDLLRHEYDVIRRNDLWVIVTEDLASRGKACANAIARLDED
jgi:uncharacterized protein with HEPN domain